jgi:pimeloyl-ACP methyl ester carboxylesterase
MPFQRDPRQAKRTGAIRMLQHLIPNGDGWLLSLNQTWHSERLRPELRPVLIVPGYGMNSFIYSYHPTGISLQGYLAEAGLEVWRADFRAQGGAVREGGTDNFSLEDLALRDLGTALEGVLERTRTSAERVDVIGGSLGGTLIFIHAVLVPDHRMGTFVCIGSPVRWVEVHPWVKRLSASPRLVGLVRFKGTRRIAELALPIVARHLRWLLAVYMNPEITDVSAVSEMARSVEDPNRHVNREIARWIRDRDLVLHGKNISEEIAKIENPLLCVLAQNDGIVPPGTAAFPYRTVGSPVKRLVAVGSKTLAMAHADLFVSREAHERVYKPIRDFLLEQAAPRAPEASEQKIE